MSDRKRKSRHNLIRYVLGALLVFVALNAFAGGFYGMSGAEGVPVEWLSGTPFSDYFIPSLILFVVVGGSSLVAAVFSHWVLDFIVHTPDLPLLGDASTKLGLGLWSNAWLTFFLEAALLVVGLWLYLRATAPKGGSRLARFGMVGVVVFLIALNVYNLFGPPPSAFMEVFGLAMVSYLGLAGIAFWLDRLRPPVDEPVKLRLSL